MEDHGHLILLIIVYPSQMLVMQQATDVKLFLCQKPGFTVAQSSRLTIEQLIQGGWPLRNS